MAEKDPKKEWDINDHVAGQANHVGMTDEKENIGILSGFRICSYPSIQILIPGW